MVTSRQRTAGEALRAVDEATTRMGQYLETAVQQLKSGRLNPEQEEAVYDGIREIALRLRRTAASPEAAVDMRQLPTLPELAPGADT